MTFLRSLSILTLLILVNGHALGADQPNRLLALVDYIGGDYANSVAAGKIINQDEYQEMLEFSSRSLELLNQIKESEGGDPAGIAPDLEQLASEVQGRGDPAVVARLAQAIKTRLIGFYKIVTSPRTLPHLAGGRTIYLENCAQCHGESGKGDGPSAATMQPREPRPANFTEATRMGGLSPFKVFNTTTFGIEGTAMPDLSALPEEQRWQVAFYVFSLRFSEEQAREGKQLFAAKELPDGLKNTQTLATSSDDELLVRLEPYFALESDRRLVLAYLRRGLLEEAPRDPLLIARTRLSEALTLYRAGNKEEAYHKSVEAYLDGFELAEPALFAKDPSFGRMLETEFTAFRNGIKSGAEIEQIERLYAQLDDELIEASQILHSEEGMSSSYIFSNAVLLILREGFEAALIIAAIIAALKATGAVAAIRYVHLGWALAVLSGILTWAFAQTVLTVSGAQRELIEGLTSVLAAIVLFWVSYWLISKAEAKKWQDYIRHKVQEALTTQRILALVGVSFLAVYREAFETVLFYQALWLESQSGQSYLIGGFLVGLGLLAALVAAVFRLRLKIPVRLFFSISSAVLCLLAFVFAGQGIKSLQAAGWFSTTPLAHLPRVPLLGIYPTVETSVAQGAMIVAVMIALFWLAGTHWHRTR